MRENAAAHGGNPSRIIIAGHSAGGAVGAYHILNHVPEVTKSKVTDEIEALIDPFYQVHAHPVREEAKFILCVGYEEELRISAGDFHEALQSAGYSSEVMLFEDISHYDIVGGSNEEIVNAIVALASGQ